MTATILQAKGLSLCFGSLQVLDGVDLTLKEGARCALIGPNGAGKSSLLNILAGSLFPTHGRLWLLDTDITRLNTVQRVRYGIVRSFQHSALFPNLTVQDALMMAIAQREGVGGQWWRNRQRQRRVLDETIDWMEKLTLVTVAGVRAKELAYGHQRLLEVGLALVCRPKVLLLDEPAAGLGFEQACALLAVINDLSPRMSILWIEHDMLLVQRFAATTMVLAQGRILVQGQTADVAQHPLLQEHYLA